MSGGVSGILRTLAWRRFMWCRLERSLEYCRSAEMFDTVHSVRDYKGIGTTVSGRRGFSFIPSSQILMFRQDGIQSGRGDRLRMTLRIF